MTTIQAAFNISSQDKGITTISAGNIVNPAIFSPARGLFMVVITDVAAASTMIFHVRGGLSRMSSHPDSQYKIAGDGFSQNTTVISGGVLSTIQVQDTATATQFELIFNSLSRGSPTTLQFAPTIDHIGGDAPVGDTTVQIFTYWCGSR